MRLGGDSLFGGRVVVVCVVTLGSFGQAKLNQVALFGDMGPGASVSATAVLSFSAISSSDPKNEG